MNRKNIRDERVEQINTKIQKEAYFIVLLITVISIVVKSFVLEMSFEHYVVELFIIVASTVYISVRSIFLGHSTMDTSKAGKRSQILFITLTSLAIAIINGIKNFGLYREHYTGLFDTKFIAVMGITFVSSFILISAVFVFAFWSNEMGRRRIERKLQEGEEQE